MTRVVDFKTHMGVFWGVGVRAKLLRRLVPGVHAPRATETVERFLIGSAAMDAR